MATTTTTTALKNTTTEEMSREEASGQLACESRLGGGEEGAGDISGGLLPNGNRAPEGWDMCGLGTPLSQIMEVWWVQKESTCRDGAWQEKGKAPQG